MASTDPADVLKDLPAYVPTLLVRAGAATLLEVMSRPRSVESWDQRSTRMALRPYGRMLVGEDSGSGDSASLSFDGHAALLRVFDHESPMSPYARRPSALAPGLFDGAPDHVRILSQDLEMISEDGALDATFLAWSNTRSWSTGTAPLTSDPHLSTWTILMAPDDLFIRTSENHPGSLDREVFDQVLGLPDLSSSAFTELLNAFNPDRDPDLVRLEMETMNYPWLRRRAWDAAASRAGAMRLDDYYSDADAEKDAVAVSRAIADLAVGPRRR